MSADDSYYYEGVDEENLALDFTDVDLSASFFNAFDLSDSSFDDEFNFQKIDSVVEDNPMSAVVQPREPETGENPWLRIFSETLSNQQQSRPGPSITAVDIDALREAFEDGDGDMKRYADPEQRARRYKELFDGLDFNAHDREEYEKYCNGCGAEAVETNCSFFQSFKLFWPPSDDPPRDGSETDTDTDTDTDTESESEESPKRRQEAQGPEDEAGDPKDEDSKNKENEPE